MFRRGDSAEGRCVEIAPVFDALEGDDVGDVRRRQRRALRSSKGCDRERQGSGTEERSDHSCLERNYGKDNKNCGTASPGERSFRRCAPQDDCRATTPKAVARSRRGWALVYLRCYPCVSRAFADFAFESSLMTDPNSSFESASVAAVLAQRSREDRTAMLDELVTMLMAVVPGVKVERALIRRNVTSVSLPLGEYLYVLKRTADDSYETSRQQKVRGVVIRTDPMEVDAFLEELGLALDVELRRTERGRAALRDFLNASGA
jgi:hypothetical protein